VFHVKHFHMNPDRADVYSVVVSRLLTNSNVNQLFTDAEITEDDVEDVFHVDAASEPAQRRRGAS